MVIIDIRRHAERAIEPDAHAPLTPAGVAMAERLATSAPAYALVVSSPQARAHRTAVAIAGRVDRVASDADVASDEVLTNAEYAAFRTPQHLAAHLQRNAIAHAFAKTQLALWEQLASELSDGQSALLITHGGNIELAAALLTQRVGGTLGPLPLGYCEGVRLRYLGGQPLPVERLPTI